MMEEFGSLPSEEEFVEWLNTTVCRNKEVALVRALEAFKSLNIDVFRKIYLLTFETKDKAKELLEVIETHGCALARPWDGGEGEGARHG